MATILVDSYTTADNNNGYTAADYLESQSFTVSEECTLSSCKLLLRATEPITGTAVVELLAHDGVYGTSSVPTGTALATSDEFDMSALIDKSVYVTFTFSGDERISLSPGYYCIALKTLSLVVLELGQLYVGMDNAGATHSGNSATYVNPAWDPDDDGAMCFYVYGTVPDQATITGVSSITGIETITF